MGDISIELTNRCNLSCDHCFTGRHGGSDDLPLDILQKVLDEGKANGFDHVSFTGGDPTVHAQFPEVLRLTHKAGYKFSFVTNGWNFPTIYHHILPCRDLLLAIVFSLDGATEGTHDQLRGAGSYRRVMRAMSICVALDLPFYINMVVTAHNRDELEDMVQLATKLGARGVRYSHLLQSFITTLKGFDLSPWERKLVEADLYKLKQESEIEITVSTQ